MSLLFIYPFFNSFINSPFASVKEEDKKDRQSKRERERLAKLHMVNTMVSLHVEKDESITMETPIQSPTAVSPLRFPSLCLSLSLPPSFFLPPHSLSLFLRFCLSLLLFPLLCLSIFSSLTCPSHLSIPHFAFHVFFPKTSEGLLST